MRFFTKRLAFFFTKKYSPLKETILQTRLKPHISDILSENNPTKLIRNIVYMMSLVSESDFIVMYLSLSDIQLTLKSVLISPFFSIKLFN